MHHLCLSILHNNVLFSRFTANVIVMSDWGVEEADFGAYHFYNELYIINDRICTLLNISVLSRPMFPLVVKNQMIYTQTLLAVV